VDAQLVGPARFGHKLRVGKGFSPIREVFQGPICRHGRLYELLTARVDRPADCARFEADWGLYYALLRQFAPYEGTVCFLNLMPREEGLERVEKCVIPGYDEDSGRIPVQAVDDAGAYLGGISYTPNLRIAS